MYAHLSGLPDHMGDLLEDMKYSREEVLHRLRFQKPKYAFRTHSGYTNFGMTAGALAAAAAAGTAWEALSDQLLYTPLGMQNTSSRFDDFLARTNRARGHVRDGNGPMSPVGKWVSKYQRTPDSQTPAAGVSSSVNDLAKWMRLHIGSGKFDGKPIVDEAALTATHYPVAHTGFNPFTGLPSFYGLGWNVSYDPQGRLRIGHSGAFALGAATNVQIVPKETLGIVSLTNAFPIGLAEGLNQTFTDLALYGKPTQDWLKIYKDYFKNPAAAGIEVGFDYSKPPTKPTLALDNDAYVGIYNNDLYGEFPVIEKDGGLAIVQGPEKLTYPLTHYDRDTFTYVTTGENAVGASGVAFIVGPDGKAASIIVENLNTNGMGTLARKLTASS